MITGQRVDQIELERRYGDAHARALWDLALEAKVARPRSHRVARDRLRSNTRAHFGGGREQATRPSWNPTPNIWRSAIAIRPHDSFAQTKCPRSSPRQTTKAGCTTLSSFHLHPLNYALGLARAADDAGVEILENSAVADVEPGGKIRVSTSGGTLTANFAVYACNGYLGALNGDLARTIMPISNYIAATEPLGRRARARAHPLGRGHRRHEIRARLLPTVGRRHD